MPNSFTCDADVYVIEQYRLHEIIVTFTNGLPNDACREPPTGQETIGPLVSLHRIRFPLQTKSLFFQHAPGMLDLGHIVPTAAQGLVDCVIVQSFLPQAIPDAQDAIAFAQQMIRHDPGGLGIVQVSELVQAGNRPVDITCPKAFMPQFSRQFPAGVIPPGQ